MDYSRFQQTQGNNSDYPSVQQQPDMFPHPQQANTNATGHQSFTNDGNNWDYGYAPNPGETGEQVQLTMPPGRAFGDQVPPAMDGTYQQSLPYQGPATMSGTFGTSAYHQTSSTTGNLLRMQNSNPLYTTTPSGAFEPNQSAFSYDNQSSWRTSGNHQGSRQSSRQGSVVPGSGSSRHAPYRVPSLPRAERTLARDPFVYVKQEGSENKAIDSKGKQKNESTMTNITGSARTKTNVKAGAGSFTASLYGNPRVVEIAYPDPYTQDSEEIKRIREASRMRKNDITVVLRPFSVEHNLLETTFLQFLSDGSLLTSDELANMLLEKQSVQDVLDKLNKPHRLLLERATYESANNIRSDYVTDLLRRTKTSVLNDFPTLQGKWDKPVELSAAVWVLIESGEFLHVIHRDEADVMAAQKAAKEFACSIEGLEKMTPVGTPLMAETFSFASVIKSIGEHSNFDLIADHFDTEALRNVTAGFVQFKSGKWEQSDEAEILKPSILQVTGAALLSELLNWITGVYRSSHKESWHAKIVDAYKNEILRLLNFLRKTEEWRRLCLKLNALTQEVLESHNLTNLETVLKPRMSKDAIMPIYYVPGHFQVTMATENDADHM
ncbi:hypothetical protein Hypma_003006 [Hypsizygus marmoreus]|uniref:Uncharacterized protein n=1 Tax=Hypsizygus marmoreus TaxID=39966 RepID=A0A369J769_HYPMA|nr:hypothetical protein Hypma_003006 [Hypsizygus marmoreus]